MRAFKKPAWAASVGEVWSDATGHKAHRESPARLPKLEIWIAMTVRRGRIAKVTDSVKTVIIGD
jgi:hypothetical protein